MRVFDASIARATLQPEGPDPLQSQSAQRWHVLQGHGLLTLVGQATDGKGRLPLPRARYGPEGYTRTFGTAGGLYPRLPVPSVRPGGLYPRYVVVLVNPAICTSYHR